MRRIIMKAWVLLLATAVLCAGGAPVLAENMEEPLAVFSSGCNRAYVQDRVLTLDEADETVRTYVQSGKTYVPFYFTVKAMGGTTTLDGQLVEITNKQGEQYYLALDRKTIYKRKNIIKEADISVKEGTLYILAEQIAEVFDATVYYNESVAYFMKNGVPSTETMERIEASLFFDRPTAERIIKDLITTNPDNSHPRLMATSADFERIRANIQNDEMVKGWYTAFKSTADNALNKPPYRWELRDGLRLLYVAQDVSTRLTALALVYQIEGDAKYAERAYLELKAICNYPNWVLTHWLDIGQMCQGAAIGFDWIYDWMTPEQRKTIANGIIRLGLNKLEVSYKEFYERIAGAEMTSAASSWTMVSTNWNPWINSGALMVSLAVAEYAPELAGFVAAGALHSFERSLWEYTPDGGPTEGLGYGDVATSNAVRILASLETACGTDYGYINVPGFPAFCYSMPYMTGPNSVFGYGDNGGSAKGSAAGTFYIANRLKDEALVSRRIQDILAKQTASVGILDLLYYNPDAYKNEGLMLDLDRYFRKIETGTLRSSWKDPNALWLGFHGGDNSIGHAHLDSGSFVLDAMGLNWAKDLGTEQLTYTGTTAQIGGDPYLLYRMSAQGHNTLQINRNMERGQMLDSFSPVTEYVSKPAGAYAKMDLSDAYRHVAKSAQRGFALIENRNAALIQDELNLTYKSDVWWLMHTPATIEVSEDGKTAILHQRGKRLRASILSPADATFYAMAAQPLEGTPTNPYQAKNADTNKLALNIPEASQTTIAVRFDPIYDDEDLNKPIGEVIPLSQWNVPDYADNLLLAPKAIYIDGEPLEGFDAEIKRYEIVLDEDLEKPPTVSVDSDYETEIVQPDNATNTKSYITVSDGKSTVTYTLAMAVAPLQPYEGLPQTGRTVGIKNITASYEQVDAVNSNYAVNINDGNLKTRWSADGEQWISFELEASTVINSISIAYHNGHTRINYFDIEISEDGEKWTEIYIGASGGNTSDFETFPFNPVKAKYVRINCHGTSQSAAGWNSLSELVVTAE